MKERKFSRSIMALFAVKVFTILFCVTTGQAQISSTFDSDCEGWLVTGDNSASCDTGNLSVNDHATGDLNFITAPRKFLGDWSEMKLDMPYDSLSVDIFFNNDSSGSLLSIPYIFRIEGPGGAAHALSGPIINGMETYTVSLHSSSWTIESGSWDAIISDIRSLRINGEYVNGAETVRIDNVILDLTPIEVFIPDVTDQYDTGMGDLTFIGTSGTSYSETGGNGGGYVGVSVPSGSAAEVILSQKYHGGSTDRVLLPRDNYPATATTDDPIDTFTGELFNQFHPDLFLGGPMPISFSRYYASSLKQPDVGHVMVDLRVIERNGTPLGETEFFRMSGPGGSAYVNIDPADLPESSLVWKTYSFPINTTIWTVDAGSWLELLENITEFKITLDFFDEPESIGFDNVGLVTSSVTEIDNPVQLHDPDMFLIDKHSMVGIYSAAYNPYDGELYALIRKTIAEGGGLYPVTGSNRGILQHAYDRPAHALFDDNGNAFISEDYAGVVNRLEWQGSSSVWVSGFHDGDDDPFGMTFAPAGFNGPNVNPGDILVSDRGSGGPDEMYAFSTDTAEGEQLVMADPGSAVVDYMDIAQGPGIVYTCDYLNSNNIYTLTPDGTLTALPLSEPIVKMGSIIYDSVDNVIYIASSDAMSVYRVDPATGQVTLVASGFANLKIGCLEIDPPTRRLWVTDQDYNRVYEIGLQVEGAGRLGDNWRHNFQWSMNVNGPEAIITNDKGRIINFSNDGMSWSQTNNMNVPYQLVESGTDYVLLDPGTSRLYTFDSTGMLKTIADGKGSSHILTYSSGDLTEVSDGLGRTLTLTYDVNHKLSTVSDGTRTVSFGYTSNDLTSVADALGNTTSFTYFNGGLMTSSTLPAGNTPYSQSWNGSGKVDSQTNSEGNTATLAYASSNTTITDTLGNTRIHTHTSTGEFNNRQDQAGLSFSMGSDATGRRNSLTDRLGDTTTIDYDEPSGNISVVTNGDGSTESYSYTPRLFGDLTFYDLTTITHADGTTENLGYDAMGNASSHTDQIGNTATGTFNANGQLLSATNVVGGTTTNTYNADGTLASRTDPAGNTTSFSYDSMKRPNRVSSADGTTSDFTYNDRDRLLSTTDGNGNTSTMTYDANGNVATVIDPLGNATTFAYDGNDRPLNVTDPIGNTASRSYNPLGKVATITDENANTVSFGYDILGRHVSTIDPQGYVWNQTYDAEAILASSTDPLGNTTTFTSDVMGRITQTSSPLGNGDQIEYDIMGRIISTTDPLSQTTAFNHDSRGLLSGIDLPGGVISTSYTRNSPGNITQIIDPNGYNWQSSFNDQGLRTSRTDPLGNVQTIVYDNRNRPAAITYADGTVRTVGYDSAGNLISSSYSGGGPVFNYSYDANNRLLSANDGPTTADTLVQSYDALGRISNSNGIGISRAGGGRIISMTLAPDKSVTYGYDTNDNLISVTDWTGANTSFSYDAAGRLISITRPATNGVNTSYTYDNDSRLVGVNENRGATVVSSIALSRDVNGQITQATRNTPQSASTATLSSMTHSFDAASQIATAGFVYDVRGRLLDDGTKTYTWDGPSRLVSVTEGGTTTTYTYDALRQRLSRSSGSVDRSYVWNIALGLNSISIERDGAGDDLRYFIHTPTGALLYSIDAVSNAHLFYHFDEMGNTLAVTDDSGTVIAAYAYTPYGKITASTLDNPFTWQGRYGIMDDGNGFYYVRARYYNANSGCFISRDPNKAIDPREVNPYQYALGNPLRFIDPSGMEGLTPEEQIRVANNRLLAEAIDGIILNLHAGIPDNVLWSARVPRSNSLLYDYMEEQWRKWDAYKPVMEPLVRELEALRNLLEPYSVVVQRYVDENNKRNAAFIAANPNWFDEALELAAKQIYSQRANRACQLLQIREESLERAIMRGDNKREANKLHAPWRDLPVYQNEAEKSLEFLNEFFPEWLPEDPDSVVPELQGIAVLC